jgi:hypothetical protein
MAASTFAAYGLYPESAGLRNVTQALLQGGFEKESICMMLPAQHPLAAMVRNASADAAEGPSSAEAAGVIGWLSEFGAVLIPKFGFFIRSQEFFRTLMAGDAPAGGSLAALGFPDEKVKRFSDQAGNAGVLVYLSCGEKTKTGSVLELLKGTGAQEAGLLDNAHTLGTATA